MLFLGAIVVTVVYLTITKVDRTEEQSRLIETGRPLTRSNP